MSSPTDQEGSPSQRIADGMVVSMRYQMWNDADGELLDECDADDALVYLHGAANVIPGLERGLAGRGVGDRIDLTVGPDEAFGEPNPEAVQVVPREEFPEDAEIEPGMAFGAFADDGEEIAIFVLDVGAEGITVTSNHPLSGLTLRYAVEVLAIRNATEEELEHGHPHDGDGGDCGVES